MQTQKYTVNQPFIETILTWVKSGEIAIPEIQRPFVWDSTKVRDLMDSLYKGFPVGYIIAWKNPNVKLKDGTLSEGKKVLIDGQQRVTALTTAILDQYVVNTEYKKAKIKIAFHPIEERFEVLNPAIQKDTAWIKDISAVISGEERISRIIKVYCENNPGVVQDRVEDALEKLRQITKSQIGLIELNADLDIETVTEIFIRINSKGVVLSQADFAMSKIAANEVYNGSNLRKCIDYFCHMVVAPDFYHHIVDVDKTFSQTEFLPKMAWLRNGTNDLYEPDYSDLLRVAFTSEFSRGKLSDLVSLLSGRNFETKTFEEEIAKRSFEQLTNGILNFINETHFSRFSMIVRSAGFVDSTLIQSQNALNFAYIVYLKLRSENYNPGMIETYVRKWFVLSLLTARYSGSPESMFDLDIKNISSRHIENYLKDVEAAELSDAYWNIGLVQQLDTSSSNSPAFNVYLAAQCKSKSRGFLSKDISIEDLIKHKGDIHHLFPKDYLKGFGLTKGQYNQVANYVYMQTEINIKVGNKAPNIYFNEILNQCKTGGLKYGSIKDVEALKENLAENGIPEEIFGMTIDDYNDFLVRRRAMMAKRMKEYYASL